MGGSIGGEVWIVGLAYIFGYGIATFLLKVSLQDLSAYQVNLLMWLPR